MPWDKEGNIKGPAGGAVASVFGRTGAVVADPNDYAAYYQPLGQGGTGAVSSVFGRVGDVLAQVGDYASFYQPLGNYEPALGNPSQDNYILVSTAAGVRSWAAPPSGTVAVSSVFGRSGDVVALAADYASFYQPLGSYEAALGNPSTDGWILSSTVAGVRSWIAPPTGSGGGGGSPAGPEGAVQLSIGGAFGGNGELTYLNGELALNRATASGINKITVTNTAAGASASTEISLHNDVGSTFAFGLYSSLTSPYAAWLAGEGGVYIGGTNQVIMADGVGRVIKFAAGASAPLVSAQVGLGFMVGTTIDPGAGNLNISGEYRIGNKPLFPIVPAQGGIPSGGAAGQVLTKVDGSNYNVQWQTPAGGGAVSSVFGRTGAVVAASGDYASYYVSLSGSYANPAWIQSLAWSKLSGLPSLVNTVFGRSGAVTAASGDYSSFYAPVAAGMPTGGAANQIIRKKSATNYDAEWDSLATAQVTSPSNPPGVLGNVGKHAGFGTGTYGPFLFTPTFSGKVIVSINFGLACDTTGATLAIALRYGTGTPPNNNANATGTAGPTYVRAGQWGANVNTPCTLQWLITGLVVGTQYWFDLVLQAGTGQTTSVAGGYFTAAELP